MCIRDSTYRERERKRVNETDRQTDRQAGRQTDRDRNRDEYFRASIANGRSSSVIPSCNTIK